MNRSFRWKKSVLVFSTAFMLAAAGIACGHTVTAWAIPASGTAAGDEVRVRDTAVSGELIGSLSDGQEVTILDETTGSDGMTWYQVTYEVNGTSRVGWVRSDLLNTSDTETENTGAEDADVTEDTADADGSSYVVAESVPESVIPSGFAETTVTYLDAETTALYSDTLDLYLLYAVNADDESDAGLFVYDLQSETMYPFIQFEMAGDSVILLEIPDEEQQLVSDRFVRTEYVSDHGSVTAYQLSEPDELVAEDASIVDYYYLYGINEIGETGWYLYNAQEGTIQKNIMNMQYSAGTAASEAEAETETETAGLFGDSASLFSNMSMIILVVVCLILLVLAILFSARYRRLRRILEGAAGAAGPELTNVSGSDEGGVSGPEEREEGSPSTPLRKESSDRSRKEAPAPAAAPDRTGSEIESGGDLDVIDLDDMEDEDYEAMLNKYLMENFPSEEAPDETAASQPDPDAAKKTSRQSAEPEFDFLDLDELDAEPNTGQNGTDIHGQASSKSTDSEFDIPELSHSEKELPEDDAFDFFIGKMDSYRSSAKKNSGDTETDKPHRRQKDD